MGNANLEGGPPGHYAPLVTAPSNELGRPSVYNYEPRVKRDRAWTWTYILGFLLFLIGGIVAATHRNARQYEVATSDYLAKYESCPAAHPIGRGLLSEFEGEGDGEVMSIWTSPKYTKKTGPWLVGTLVLSLAAGVGYVKLFEKWSKGAMVAGAILQVVLCFLFGIYLMLAGSIVPAAFLLIYGGICLGVHLTMRRHYELCSRLFHIATKGLQANPCIIIVVLMLWGTLVVGVFITAVFVGFGLENGQILQNPEVQYGSHVEVYSKTHEYKYCRDTSTGEDVSCCVWSLKPLAAAYVVYAVLFGLWTFCILFELKVFSIAGTVTQWYFAPPGASTKGTLTRSLRHGLGASFGSLVVGGLVLTIITLMRLIVRFATSMRRNIILAFVCMAIRIILLTILNWFEFLTRFATIWAAVKGDSFFNSGRQSTELLTRNLLDSTIVWWFPPWVLLATNLVLSASWGMIMYFVAIKGFADGMQGAALTFAITLGFITYLMLSLVTSILLNVVEAVYFCYASDKDTQMVSNEEVHEIYGLLPAKGAVVEQPEGQMMYGAPQNESATSPAPPQVATRV